MANGGGPCATLIRALFDYDAATGIFTRKVSRSNRVKVGETVGCKNAAGYLVISVDGKLHYAHRLAWLHVHGRWPAAQLDHINGDQTDNRIANLREATDADNRQNVSIRKDNRTGLIGVTKVRGCERWSARIKIDRKAKYLGCFDSPEKAHAAYLAAKASLHSFQPTPRA
jgi:hypothetical protein